MRTVAALMIAACVLALGSRSVRAQSFQGGLRGAVHDAGGVVPGVEVTLTNDSTSIKRSTVTNSSGEYVFAAVDPGTYTLRVSLQGYKTVERPQIKIGTQQFIVLDIGLEVGSVSEQVTVTAAAPLIETANASKGGTLDSSALETLPAPGRAAFLVGVSIPTVIPAGDAQFNRQQDQTNASLLSLGGGPLRANNYLVDGVQITDMRNRASANPTIEALEGVTVQVHTYDAEMGRTGGGVFNVTAKSGTNNMHGSGFYQTRPNSWLTNNYFSEKAGIPKPDAYYRLYGGGVGGPIIKNRTFFYFATENYRSLTTRGIAATFPTSLELQGDFSQTFNSDGQLVTIYDPLTTHTDPATGQLVRTPFQGNKIPANRINPVSAAIAKYFPKPDQNVSNTNPNYNRTAQIIDRAQMYTVKVEHKFTDKVSLSGFYLYNKTDEPCSDYWEPGLTGANRFADPLDYLLKRRPQVLAINNTWVPSNQSVLTFRFGYTRFPDNQTLTLPFDPATLGFSPAFTNALALKKFPFGDIEGYDDADGDGAFGAIDPTQINYYSHSLNGSYSRFFGGHTVKAGADYRRAGVDAFIPGQGSGDFRFDRYFTSADPLSDGTDTSGNGFASFLLGYPTGDPTNLSRVPISTPLNAYTDYFAGYVQDDWRVSSKFTLNYGLRLERETGLTEQQNRFTVAFDQNAISPLNSQVKLPDGRQVKGGLVYAGQNGAPTHQGDPPAIKPGPRFGAVYAFNDKTVVRGGYGMFWAPWNYQQPNTTNFGQIGYTQNTFIQQGFLVPTVTMTNPFPQGLSQPVGNAQGLMTGVGGNIDYIDQNKRAPRVQQWSADVQRQLPGNMALKLSYLGSHGDHLNLGAQADARVNINQLDPKFLSLGSSLLDPVANPFYGIVSIPNTTACAGASSDTGQCVQRRQLLRPFPQFGDVNARQMTAGRSNYSAAVIELERRVHNGWGGRFSYTYSVLKDNQWAQQNFFSKSRADSNGAFPQNSYDLNAEYSYSIVDVPHRLVLAPIVELPFGEGKPWMNKGVGSAILGGWTLAAIIDFESGFPIAIEQNSINANDFSGQQRPNIASGSANTSGSREDRFNNWLDPSAFTITPPFTLGNAPRTLNDVRTPTRNNTDMVISKDVRLTGEAKGQFRVEILNLTNTVKVRGPEQRLGRSSFGLITSQAGFMRIFQLTFRMTF